MKTASHTHVVSGYKDRLARRVLVGGLLVGLAAAAATLPAGTAIALSYPPPPGPPPSPPPSPMPSVSLTSKANPSLGTILADGSGMTLYNLTSNGSPVLCTGTCATVWSPLTEPAGSPPPAAPSGFTAIGTVTNANGTQVTWQGLPLYGFAGDRMPSDANGEGIVSFGGVWHAVKATPCTAGPLSPPPSGKVTRLAGTDRDATSVVVSKASFAASGSAGAVVLASDAAFPDALAGTALAVAKHGPVLLTTPSSLNPSVGSEISRVLSPGGTVYLLGGGTALASSIDSAVMSLGDTPQRVAGANRFGTAVAIAGVLGDPHTILEATGTDFADALSAGAAAGKSGGAVLLTSGSSQAAEAHTYLMAHPGDTRTAVGGPAVSADPGATPLVGTDRFGTAVAVAQHFFTTPATLGFASGFAFPDALSGGAAVAAGGGPMLLVPACGSLPGSVASYLSSVGAVSAASLYGGPSAVGDDVLAKLEAAI